MNNSNLNENYNPTSTNDIIFLYVCGPVAVVGFLLSILSAFIFSSDHFKLTNHPNLFAYLRIECTFMAVNLFIKIIFAITNNNKWKYIAETLFAKIVYTYLNGYLSSILETCVTVSNILSTVCCLAMLEQTPKGAIKFVSSQRPFFVMALVFIVSGFIFIYIIFYTEASHKGPSVTLTLEFFKSTHSIFDSIAFTVRDVVLLFVLIILNVLMVVRIRRILSKKMEIVSNQSPG